MQFGNMLPATGTHAWRMAMLAALNADADASLAAMRADAEAPAAGLPAHVLEMFRRAEALCKRQEFGEAVPLFERVLELLKDGCTSTPAVGAAEGRAHPGVADRLPPARGLAGRLVDAEVQTERAAA